MSASSSEQTAWKWQHLRSDARRLQRMSAERTVASLAKRHVVMVRSSQQSASEEEAELCRLEALERTLPAAS
eukprot:CAMPEP_0168474442 /NCGR_PEP_ID=MMETSP0228-20121227/60845_1 /TAXON_ID=133427 /ORGANISM="Protoceratium reticulatum, Strain CCCM 535 (=CCMP 1889)" /LENGTH=71 /DNA_ID=CAMNT_0008490473 /DNA_START=305 /DNA_END=517 /DNA_ORIENTATION=+